jgi:hypothetical protein
MFIDVDTGVLKTKNIDFQIGPNLTYDELTRSAQFQKENLIIDNGDYKGYSQKNILVGEILFSFILYFYKNKISQISFGLANKQTDWSFEFQNSQKNEHDKIMLNQFGVIEKNTPWGIIISRYDKKSGFSEINIKYSLTN